jgi:hypothetical protein
MKLSRWTTVVSLVLISHDLANAFSVSLDDGARRPQGRRNDGVIRRNTILNSAAASLTDDSSSSDVLVSLTTDPMFIEPLKNNASPASVPNGKSPDELIAIAKRFLLTSKGLGGDPDMLADDFQFQGPVVGPLSKNAFVTAIGSVDFNTAFPNWTPQFYGFFVDPLEEKGNRVWYTARGCGVNEGPLLPFAPEATGRRVDNPPQACSLTIDHDTGLILKYTIGYVIDRSVGNTGGLGGLYGILYAIGKPLPFPEAQPWKQSLRYSFFNKLGSLINR